jgi:hypothetical protein
VLAATLATVSAFPAQAGGLIGEAINIVAPGAGTKLDDAHREFKEANPGYAAAEEAVSAATRHTTAEPAVESAGPVLAAMIEASRVNAINAGVFAVPPQIRPQLRLTFSDAFLDQVRFRVGQGNEFSLQANAFRFGDAAAITLGDVIVFASWADASDPALWAHELGHVDQYARWGVLDFAKRYVRDHQAIEDEAVQVSQQWLAASQTFGRFGNASTIQPAPQLPPATYAHPYRPMQLVWTPWGWRWQ